jgi:hypothetical protein
MSALRGVGNGRIRSKRGLFCTLMSGTLERPSVLLVTCGIGAFHAESDCELISVKFMTACSPRPGEYSLDGGESDGEF